MCGLDKKLYKKFCTLYTGKLINNEKIFRHPFKINIEYILGNLNKNV